MSVYSNLARKRRTKKDRRSRQRAEYLASLPKHPVKRLLYRLHPKRVAAFWFSKRGAITLVKLAGIGILLMVLLVGSIFAYYRKDLEAVRPGKIAERVQTTVTKYYDRNGELLWEDKGDGNYRLAVDSNEISKHMKNATVAIEDEDFYKHGGVSLVGIMRSVFNNAQGGSVQGGSTLTQQLVKQVFLAEEAHKRGIDGIPRKIKEVILAMEVERMYSKEQILNLYLNESPYGGRRNGVESAALSYFGKHAKDLTLAESALLAAIPNEPPLYDPYTGNNKALISRQRLILSKMVERGYITQDEADAAKKVAVLDTLRPISDQLENIKAPHFVLMVKSQLESELGTAIVGRGGLSVKTTLDYRIQKKLEEATNAMFESHMPATYGFTNAASTVEDVKTGQIVALLGSRDFRYPGFGEDNAALASIQPGSTIKPLVYAKLFEDKGSDAQNFGAGSILADDRGADKIYGAKLQNWDGKYKGSIPIRYGLAWSRNVPAVKAMYISGVDETLSFIRDMGDSSYCTVGQEATVGLAAAIGGCGAVQVEHLNAISSIARLGVYKPYSTILEAKNTQGDVLVSYKESSKQVGDPQATYIVSDILSDAGARRGAFGGISYRLSVDGVKTATKTGTSDMDTSPKDLWMVSYSPVLSMATWLGNPDPRALSSRANSTFPGEIIRPVMQFAHAEVYQKDGRWKPGDWLTQPAGIQRIRGDIYPSWYNKSSGRKSTKMTFDRVSKKRATDCTPGSARIEIDVITVKDPVSKKVSYLAPDGYDPRKEDDKHSCDDAKPSVSVSTSGSGKRIYVSYKRGRFELDNVSVEVNGSNIATFAASSSGSKTLTNSVDADRLKITVTVTDKGYYTDQASTTVNND